MTSLNETIVDAIRRTADEQAARDAQVAALLAQILEALKKGNK